jgi:hypothetical protein
MFPLVLVGTVLLAVALTAVILLGVAGASRRSGFTSVERRRVTTRTAIGIAVWLGATAALASTGVFSEFDRRPPTLMVVVVASFLLFAFATSNATATRLVRAAPPHWAIALQTMRVPIELGLWALFVLGKLPVHLTFEGRNFDVVVGVTAPFVAFALARGWIGKRIAIAWNVGSLAALVNIVGMAVTTLPGPFHLDWPGVSNVVLTTAPLVWLPTFFVPVALFGHLVSLRQLRRSEERRSSATTGWSLGQ